MEMVKEYLFEVSVPDALIPYVYMSNFCATQDGRFFQVSKSLFRYLRGTHIPALNNQRLISATEVHLHVHQKHHGMYPLNLFYLVLAEWDNH